MGIFEPEGALMRVRKWQARAAVGLRQRLVIVTGI